MKQLNFKPTPRQIILAVVGLVVFIGVTILAYNVILGWKLSPIAGVPVDNSGGGVAAATQDVSGLPTPAPTISAPDAALPAAWDGASRVSILVMGLDYGDWSADRNGPSRTDTMILLTIDPQTKTAAMLSIPRDMWVNIPGYGYGKINTAYYLGEANKLPGGGPALAVKTVEQFLGVPIQYYAQIDFWAFVTFIDDIGGIDINVPHKIKLDPMGAGPDDVTISAGPHHFDGQKALAYARNRYTQNGDIDRAMRQQQVIFAVRDKIMDPSNFPFIITHTSALYQSVQNGIKTNLPLDDAVKLAVLADQIPRDNIKQAVIDFSMVTLGKVVQNGQSLDIFKPIPDKIRELRDSIFVAGGPLSPDAQGANALDLAKQENATVSVLNGTYTSGIASKTSDYLKAQGINVVSVGNAAQASSVTTIIDHSGRPYTLKYFQQLFGLKSSSQIINKYDPSAPADIEIILGDDWAANNPMP